MNCCARAGWWSIPGLHAKRWTRQQAIDYGIEASEVERYVVFPRPSVLLHDRRAENRRAAREGPQSLG